MMREADRRRGAGDGAGRAAERRDLRRARHRHHQDGLHRAGGGTERFAAYKREVDPQGWFNRGKLLEGSGLSDAYTPSLRLLQQEALILEASELGRAQRCDVKDCLRCGKCKPVVHDPRAAGQPALVSARATRSSPRG
ncbi:MAG: hypothetical protein U5L11_09195 [Arhodomonas sp.]|nr:hypothetical protein [Arhodomonas sp.]